MISRRTTNWLVFALALALGLAVACGRDDATEAVSAAKEAAGEAAPRLEETTGDLPGGLSE